MWWAWGHVKKKIPRTAPTAWSPEGRLARYEGKGKTSSQTKAPATKSSPVSKMVGTTTGKKGKETEREKDREREIERERERERKKKKKKERSEKERKRKREKARKR